MLNQASLRESPWVPSPGAGGGGALKFKRRMSNSTAKKQGRVPKKKKETRGKERKGY